MYYIYQTRKEANAAILFINSLLPRVGLRRGKPALDKGLTTCWVKAPLSMVSGEFAIPQIPTKALDNSGELVEVDGVWEYAGIPEDKRLGFMAKHGQDIRTLESEDLI